MNTITMLAGQVSQSVPFDWFLWLSHLFDFASWFALQRTLLSCYLCRRKIQFSLLYCCSTRNIWMCPNILLILIWSNCNSPCSSSIRVSLTKGTHPAPWMQRGSGRWPLAEGWCHVVLKNAPGAFVGSWKDRRGRNLKSVAEWKRTVNNMVKHDVAGWSYVTSDLHEKEINSPTLSPTVRAAYTVTQVTLCFYWTKTILQ